MDKLLRGDATLKEAGPDEDLGKPQRLGFRNIVREGDEDRIFGVPTIRDDI